jgi:arylsulfatase A-like enzyme
MAGQRRDASRSTSRRGGRVGFACLGLFALFAIGAVSAEKKPNIIVLIVDDLDNGHMASLDYMPFVQKRLVKGGTSFENAVVTTALCCPTRTTFLTGLLAHNSNSTSTMHPHGGYDPFFDRGLVKDYLPLWLRDAGYRS